MKKLTAVLLAACMLFSLAACGQQELTITFDTVKPWSGAGYERSAYSIAKYRMVKSGKTTVRGDVIAEGSVTMEIRDNYTTEGGIAYSRLDTAYTLTYNDKADELDRGVTDSFESNVVFQTNSLAAKSSYKKVSVGARTDVADKSYTISADYMTGTSVFTPAVGDEKTLNLKDGTNYDNELAFYLVRSLGLAVNGQLSMNLTNLYDCHEAKSSTPYTMTVTTAETLTSVTLGAWAENFGIPKNERDECNIDCYSTKLAISSKQSGPPIQLYYTKESLRQTGGTETFKVLTQIVETIYNVRDAVIDYEVVYTLSDYSTTKAA